jgi:antitoxin (DNA-binding transcriptional repressor) of toxin-antitoxin stability system
MDETLISVTLAARKFSDCINRVRYQGTSFLLEKNGVPVARIVPLQPNFSSDFEQLARTLRQSRHAAIQQAENTEQPPEPTADESEVAPSQEAAKPPRRPNLNW